MVPIIYRPARADELQATQQHIVRSINDLSERHGFGSMASVRTPDFQLFSLNDDPAGLWTAERDGEIVGSAFSWVCGDLWFLAELFISPALQGQGIGGELLKRALQHADTAGAAHKALITFTFNRVSQGLYIRHGLFPRLPVYMFGAARAAVMARLPGERLRSIRIENTAAHSAALAAIDVSALGVSRAKHHAFLAGDAATKGFLLYDGGDCVAYAYVNQGGHVGPFAVARADAAGPAFVTALHLAAESGAAQVSAFIPGTSEAVLKIAAGQGMRITFPMVLMSSDAFGDWSRYLPRNPGFHVAARPPCVRRGLFICRRARRDTATRPPAMRMPASPGGGSGSRGGSPRTPDTSRRERG
jgi:GNAT superfamily N-acetyltransferase